MAIYHFKHQNQHYDHADFLQQMNIANKREIFLNGHAYHIDDGVQYVFRANIATSNDSRSQTGDSNRLCIHVGERTTR